jgi:carbonic anhydrase/acetyltransferase-like protein (isoleucine patch superfamily)
VKSIVLPFEGVAPRISSSVFLAPGAVVVGDVELRDEVSLWFHTVIRGDVAPVFIGQGTNIQDGCVVHGESGKFDVRIGKNVTVGHQAIIHGCIVEDESLVGMGARILNGCLVGTGSLVAAGAVLREGTTVPPGSLVAGVPAQVRREVNAEELEMIREIPRHYIEFAQSYRAILS